MDRLVPAKFSCLFVWTFWCTSFCIEHRIVSLRSYSSGAGRSTRMTYRSRTLYVMMWVEETVCAAIEFAIVLLFVANLWNKTRVISSATFLHFLGTYNESASFSRSFSQVRKIWNSRFMCSAPSIRLARCVFAKRCTGAPMCAIILCWGTKHQQRVHVMVRRARARHFAWLARRNLVSHWSRALLCALCAAPNKTKLHCRVPIPMYLGI